MNWKELEEYNFKVRTTARDVISFCILKGRTTTQEQFERFVESIKKSLSKLSSKDNDVIFELYFYCDTEEAINLVEKEFVSHNICDDTLIYCLKRDSDAGDLRNEFMSTLVQIEAETRDHSSGTSSYFGFMDGDDQVNTDFFTNIGYYYNMSDRLLILNPASVYSDNGLTDTYPLKWAFNASNARIMGKSLQDLALEDVIGGQAWGKLYHYDFLKSGAKFGKGLYEDVPFWYQICYSMGEDDWWKVMPDVIYYWRRDNTNSLTRVTPSWAAFCNAFDNLDAACDIAINKFGVSYNDVRVWKRYTVGVLNLLRNAYKTGEEKEKFINKVLERINPVYFRPTQLEVIEPDYIRRVREDCPDYDELIKHV